MGRFYTPLQDQELVDLLRAGDERALKEICERYWKRLLAVAYNHTKDKQLAEEMVSDVFMSLWRRRNQVQIRNLSAFLATAVKFSVFKQLLKEKRRAEILQNNYRPETCQLDEAKIEAKFLQEYLQGVVEELPEKCRLVFRYSRNKGMNIPDIARQMQIAPKTVEAHLCKALKTLRLSLKNIGLLIVLLITC